MMTVKEVSRTANVTVRALHYYDRIGLLRPSAVSEAGYRLYGEADLERLGQILLFRELQFPLKDIKTILDSPDYDRAEALSRQIELLTLKKERTEKLIAFARQLRDSGGALMDFDAFDRAKEKTLAEEAKSRWGNTAAYREFEEKAAERSPEKSRALSSSLMEIFSEFGCMKTLPPADGQVQEQVKKLRSFITENYYTCTLPILSSLGEMYASGGEFTENIDAAGGAGTAGFSARAIREYCRRGGK